VKEPARVSDKRAFDEIVQKYTSYVYNVAYRMLGNPHDAEDATQGAFLSAYRAWGRFRGEADVATWLYRIAVNAALMKLRKEKRLRQLTQVSYEEQDIPDWAQSPEDAALNSELRRALESGLMLLPPDLRAAVVLRDVQGLSNAEASAALSMSVAAFKARLHRGRLLLRKHLGQTVAEKGRAPGKGPSS
jgi:RNA polymerase sigma-70 factor (ECF subfamily)